MTAVPGTLYLMPNALDFGIAASSEIAIAELVPGASLRVAARLDHWLVENAKTARAFLRRVDAIYPLHRPLQSIAIVELPRPPKGRAPVPEPRAMEALLAPALAGADLGLLSEAGLVAVADPGAAAVAAAHRLGVAVRALPGASAIALAVAASGLNGQSFAFGGYVPVPSGERARRIGQLEQRSRSLGQTQLVIETPYRNQPLLDALVAGLDASTQLAVSIGLTTAAERTRSEAVSAWRARPERLPPDLPAVFAFLAG